MTWYEQAEARLKDEYGKVKSQKEGVMKSAERDALQEFCRQNEEFAQAVAQGGSFPDCMTAVAKGVGQLGGGARLAGHMPLNAVEGVLRSQIDAETMTLTTPEMVLPISDQVQCYNKATGTWYTVGTDDESHREALRLTLAFSNDLTVYYDRSPEEGGKVRVWLSIFTSRFFTSVMPSTSMISCRMICLMASTSGFFTMIRSM